jgi:hypothetical protein
MIDSSSWESSGNVYRQSQSSDLLTEFAKKAGTNGLVEIPTITDANSWWTLKQIVTIVMPDPLAGLHISGIPETWKYFREVRASRNAGTRNFLGKGISITAGFDLLRSY